MSSPLEPDCKKCAHCGKYIRKLMELGRVTINGDIVQYFHLNCLKDNGCLPKGPEVNINVETYVSFQNESEFKNYPKLPYLGYKFPKDS